MEIRGVERSRGQGIREREGRMSSWEAVSPVWFPSVHFVPCSQLPISVILHKDSAKFIHQAKVIVAKSTE